MTMAVEARQLLGTPPPSPEDITAAAKLDPPPCRGCPSSPKSSSPLQALSGFIASGTRLCGTCTWSASILLWHLLRRQAVRRRRRSASWLLGTARHLQALPPVCWGMQDSSLSSRMATGLTASLRHSLRRRAWATWRLSRRSRSSCWPSMPAPAETLEVWLSGGGMLCTLWLGSRTTGVARGSCHGPPSGSGTRWTPFAAAGCCPPRQQSFLQRLPSSEWPWRSQSCGGPAWR
mmetsp:Transcript_35457/g.100391  ORF Transcript_35457/g.100391 Transcript_35457/m.100391 type:complete len:233 (-) Transcript_35457:679-1377(-)